MVLADVKNNNKGKTRILLMEVRCMLMALDQSNNYVSASSIDINKGKYVCPGCGAPVYLKKGTIRVPHFSHYKQSDCRVFSEGETEEHLEGKQLLYDWLTISGISVQMEAYIPELKQRPDLLCWMQDGTPLAVEFQCSRLSMERMLERTEGYEEKGYFVLWILGKNFFLNKRLSPFQKLFLTEAHAQNILFFQLDVRKKELSIAYDFSFHPKSTRTCYRKRALSLTEPLHEQAQVFYQIKAKRREPRPTNLLLMQENLYQKRNYRDKEVVRFLHEIYEEGDNLISLPVETYLPVKTEWMIESLSFRWKYALLRWWQNKEVGSVVHQEEVEQTIKELQQAGRLKFCLSPMINEKTFHTPIQEYVQLLCQRGLLAAVSSTEWVVLSYPHRCRSEEEKRMKLLELS
ncbi:competence protein CoiA family protein [Atopococcus tabaci]|uniref:competence protein CoiA family protein n=1 Tax=Atopococcus tabaci TaxID=269774 RepID=UPI000A015D4C